MPSMDRYKLFSILSLHRCFQNNEDISPGIWLNLKTEFDFAIKYILS